MARTQTRDETTNDEAASPVDQGTLDDMKRRIAELEAMNKQLSTPEVIETPTDAKDIARHLTDHLEGADNADRYSVAKLVEIVRNLADHVAGTTRGRTDSEATEESGSAA